MSTLHAEWESEDTLNRRNSCHEDVSDKKKEIICHTLETSVK